MAPFTSARFALFTLVLATTFAAQPARSCDCRDEGEWRPDAAFADADVVLEGTVEETRGAGRWLPFARAMGWMRDREYAVRVLRSWKGVTEERVIVASDALSTCGVELAVGSTYLLFGSSQHGRTRVSVCDHPLLRDEVPGTVRAFLAARPPIALAPPRSRWRSVAVACGIVAAVVAASVAVMRWLRRGVRAA